MEPTFRSPYSLRSAAIAAADILSPGSGFPCKCPAPDAPTQPWPGEYDHASHGRPGHHSPEGHARYGCGSWTGHPSRLCRTCSPAPSAEAYDREAIDAARGALNERLGRLLAQASSAAEANDFASLWKAGAAIQRLAHDLASINFGPKA